MRSREHARRLLGRRTLGLLAATALVLTACGDDDDAAEDDDDASTTEVDSTEVDSTDSGGDTTPASPGSAGTGVTTAPPDTGGSTVPPTTGDAPPPSEEAVVVGAVLEPTSLNIFTQAGAALDQILLDNIYETVLHQAEDGEIEAGLAELPEISADGTVYTFTLQEGITFHDGDPLTASDVAWSLDQSRAPDANASPQLASVESVAAPDDTTLEITLSARDNDLLYFLTRRAGVVLNEGATGIENTANGTGPFLFEEWNQGSSITLARNDDYWGEPPQIAGVTFQYFTDPQAAVNALTTGDADVLTGVSSDLVGPLQEDPAYVVNEGTTNGEYTLGFNNSREPFTDQRVRQAIRQAIDKEGVLALFNGFGQIIGGPVPPTDPWYEDLTDTAPYDPDAARALLEEAGYGDGLDLTLVVPNFYASNISEYVASQLAEVGITVEIQPVEFSVWLEQVFTNAEYDLTFVLHTEPRDIANYANPEYYWRYDSPEVQQLIADAKVAATPDEATELLKQAARQIAEDSPVDWLMLDVDITVSRTGVSGYPIEDVDSRFDASGIVVE